MGRHDELSGVGVSAGVSGGSGVSGTVTGVVGAGAGRCAFRVVVVVEDLLITRFVVTGVVITMWAAKVVRMTSGPGDCPGDLVVPVRALAGDFVIVGVVGSISSSSFSGQSMACWSADGLWMGAMVVPGRPSEPVGPNIVVIATVGPPTTKARSITATTGRRSSGRGARC
jgi:hypothetical protein